MKTIGFICTQNVFRSFSAHYIANDYIRRHDIPNLTALSAGTVADPWEVPYPETLALLRTWDIDASGHHQTKLNEAIHQQTDVFICMTLAHLTIARMFKPKRSYLFNDLAFGRKTDLNDDVENRDWTTEENGLATFIQHTITTIYTGMPTLISRVCDDL